MARSGKGKIHRRADAKIASPIFHPYNSIEIRYRFMSFVFKIISNSVCRFLIFLGVISGAGQWTMDLLPPRPIDSYDKNRQSLIIFLCLPSNTNKCWSLQECVFSKIGGKSTHGAYTWQRFGGRSRMRWHNKKQCTCNCNMTMM